MLKRDVKGPVRIKESKNSFLQERIRRIGRVLAESLATIDPAKVGEVTLMPILSMDTELSSLFVMIGFHQCFISGFSKRSASLPSDTIL